MQTLQADYFAAYRHLKLSRDAKGVLVAEFHSDGGPYIMNAQGHTEFVDAFHRIGQDRANKIVIMTGAGGNFIGDVEWSSFGDVTDPDIWSRIHDEGLQVLENIANIRVPVIAAVEGRAHIHSDYALLANVIVAAEGATFEDVGHFAVGVTPGDGVFTTWSYRAGPGRAEAFLLNPQPLSARGAYEWGVVAEVVPNGKAVARARELADLYLRAPEVTRRNTRIHFILGIPTNAISNSLNRGMSHSAWLISVTGTDNTILVRTWDEDRFVGKKASESFIENTEGDDGVFLATSLDGVDVFDVYVRSKLTGWKIAAGLPLAMYEAPLRHTLYALTAIIVFGLTCSIAISFVYARYLLKPFNALQALVASSSVANFKLQKSGVKEVDDVADALAKSFMLLNDRDQHQQVLVKELNHRAKNALTAIQAIAYATQKRSKSLDAFVRTFESRLAAMARSYDVITRNDWHSSELKELILECCKPFADLERIKIDGPSVLLSPKALIGMGLVIHELATNAVKYGALSNTTGKYSSPGKLWGEGNWKLFALVGRSMADLRYPRPRIRVLARN